MFVTPIVKSRWKIQTINRQKKVLVKSNISMPCSQSWFLFSIRKDYLFTVSQLKKLKRNYRPMQKKAFGLQMQIWILLEEEVTIFLHIVLHLLIFYVQPYKVHQIFRKKRKKKCIHRIWKTFKVIECMIVDRK